MNGAMVYSSFHSSASPHPGPMRLAVAGFVVGLVAGAVVAIFRVVGEQCYLWLRLWAAEGSVSVWLPVFGIAFISAIIVSRLIMQPGISFGGASWIRKAMADGQPHVWRLVLLPKFVGSFLVKACGLSVGMEGPSIQLGCAAALGLRRFGPSQTLERRYFILGGCASGLAAAFSAPLCGAPYVIEVMHEPLEKRLLLFLLSGALGVYISCNQLFGLGAVMPMPGRMPDLPHCLMLIPLVVGASLVGLFYAWLLRLSARFYAAQKLIPHTWLPLLAFMGAALMLFLFPDITGEGPEIFGQLAAAAMSFLAWYIAAKLLFTAFCYGTAIPCGVMVPILTIGCVCGAFYALVLQSHGWLDAEYAGACMVLGMGASFGAAERAPITALFLVVGMTGAWDAAMGILTAAAAGAYVARLADSRPI